MSDIIDVIIHFAFRFGLLFWIYFPLIKGLLYWRKTHEKDSKDV